MPSEGTILLCAIFEESYMGTLFAEAADELKLPYSRVDFRKAFSRNRYVNSFAFHFLDKRPIHQKRFEKEVLRCALGSGAEIVIGNGVHAFSADGIRALKKAGLKVVNYLTDDPWNPNHYCYWFAEAAREYDWIFSTKTAVVPDLKALGCKNTVYLPFAYAPQHHFKEAISGGSGCDVLYVGGGDPDRVIEFSKLLTDPGLKIELYGGYWNHFPETRRFACGFLDPQHYRLKVVSAKVTIINGRKANRDEHAMRSFEIPAMGGCAVVENTLEHQQIFGPEGECVLYYSTPDELHEKIHILLNDETLRKNLAENCYRRITENGNRYSDRLKFIKETCYGQ